MFASEVLGPREREGDDVPEDLGEPYFRIWWSFGYDPSEVQQRKKTLRRVVVMRNALVHKLVASWDPNSP